MEFQAVWVFDADTGQDFWFPVYRSIAVLAMLGEAGMRPFPGFCGTLVFFSTEVDAAAGLTDVDRLWFALAVELIYPFAFARWWLGFVAGAENVLKSLAAFVEEVASCLCEGALELLRDAGDEGDGCVGAELNFLSSFAVEWEDFEEIAGLLLLLLLILLLLLLMLLALLLFLFSSALWWDVCLGNFLKFFSAMAVVLVDVECVLNLFLNLSGCRA